VCALPPRALLPPPLLKKYLAFARRYCHPRLTPEAALVLNGLLSAWVSVFRVLGPHPEAGFILEDVLRGGEVWVLDQGLAESAEPGAILAARLARVCGFAMTSGVLATVLRTRLLPNTPAEEH
jgi:hypothetical protein